MLTQTAGCDHISFFQGDDVGRFVSCRQIDRRAQKRSYCSIISHGDDPVQAIERPIVIKLGFACK